MRYFISPRFLDRLAVHLVKNFLDLPGVPVPLILGIHGRKGEGKTFQCDLAFREMDVNVVRMSGGELESPDAGDPARLIRLRYREASQMVKVQGKMAVLLINDLDAGAGRFDRLTQYTVNTQLVNATLMNIADAPTNVQLPGSYDDEPLRRVPIVVTGNDFGTLYAPLIRDGRMEKFYWEPTPEERLEIVKGIYADSNLSEADAERLIAAFPDQAIDFFGAIKSRLYDDLVRQFVREVGLDKISRRAANPKGDRPAFTPPPLTLATLRDIGDRLVAEQRRVRELHLAREYNPDFDLDPAGVARVVHGGDGPFASGNPARSGDAPALGSRDRGGAAPDGNGHQGRRRQPRREPAAAGSANFPAPAAGSAPPPNGDSHEETRSPSETLRDRDRPAFPSAHREASVPETRPLSEEDRPDDPVPPLVQPLNPTARSQLLPIVSNGYRLGIEYADKRHFQVNSWQCYAVVEPHRETEAVAKLERCLAERRDHYVRLVAIDPDRRKRLRETVIRRP